MTYPQVVSLGKHLITIKKTGSFLDHLLRIGTTKQTGPMEDKQPGHKFAFYKMAGEEEDGFIVSRCV